MITFTELEAVLKQVFPNQQHFTLEQTRDDIEEWDSIGHLNLIVEIEDQFNVKFSSEEIQKMDSIAKIYSKLE